MLCSSLHQRQACYHQRGNGSAEVRGYRKQISQIHFKTGMAEFELSEIEKRLQNATPGPWTSYVEGRDHTSGDSFIMTGTDDNRGEDIYLTGATLADQHFIAHARQDIPKLIEEVRRLRQLVGE